MPITTDSPEVANLFPDGTKRGPAPIKPLPFVANPNKPLNEVHVETVTATGGSRKLSVSGVASGAINFNASASTIRVALEALSTVANKDVTVSGSAGGPYTIEFSGQYEGKNAPVLTATASLTGPGVVNTATVVKGAGGQWTVTLGANATGGGFTLTVDTYTTDTIPYNATGAAVLSALELLPNIHATTVDVVVTQSGTGTASDPYVNTYAFAGAFAAKMVDFKVDPALLTGGTSTLRVVSPSILRDVAVEKTNEALSALGFKGASARPVDSRIPRDIGDPLRVPGEDFHR